jgi:glycosyltransferase involved in cell wall biosynthesis
MSYRILYIAYTAAIGGGEVSLLHLVKRLDRRLFFPVVAVPSQGPLVDKLRAMGIRVKITSLMEFSRYRVLSFLIATVALARLIKEEKIDLVHVNSIKNGEQGLFAARLAGTPCIWHVRNFVTFTGASKVRIIACKRLKKMIAISEAVKSDLIAKLGITAEKVVRIYNGVDVREYHPRISGEGFRNELNASSLKLIGMVGRISPEKGHEVFLHAGKEVLKRYPSVRLIIVGESRIGTIGYDGTLLNLVNDLGIQNKVIFTGFRNDIPEVMAALDLVVVPSVAEPFGRVIIEAMAMQKPVIATNSGGAPEILSEGGGMLVEPGNVEQLRQAISKVLEDEQLASIMGKEGRKIVIERFGIDKNVSQIEKLYRTLLI